MLGEDPDLRRAIVCNDANPTCGSRSSVHAGQEESITARPDDRISALADMARAARLTTQTRHDVLDNFVDDPEPSAQPGLSGTVAMPFLSPSTSAAIAAGIETRAAFAIREVSSVGASLTEFGSKRRQATTI